MDGLFEEIFVKRNDHGGTKIAKGTKTLLFRVLRIFVSSWLFQARLSTVFSKVAPGTVMFHFTVQLYVSSNRSRVYG